MGFPVLPRSPCARIPPPLPRWNRWVLTSLASPTIAAFPDLWPGRLPHQPFRGLHSVRYRCGLRARQITYVTLYTEGFGRFVSSTTAPIAAGWSESCRVGLPSHWGIAPFHGAPQIRHKHRISTAQPDCIWLENKKIHGGQGRNRTTDTRIFSPLL